MSQKQPFDQFLTAMKKDLVRKYFIMGLFGLSLLGKFIFNRELDSVSLAMFVLFTADANSEDRLIKALKLLKESPAPQPEPETVETVETIAS